MIEIETEALRARFFNRVVPVRITDQCVYHGSPLEGMVEIMRGERLYPQGHAELPDEEFLSVSVNDNVLTLFADGERATGFCSIPTLRVAHLDPFHNSVATGRSGCVTVEDIEVKWACRLGYVDKRLDPDMQGSDLRRLLRNRECHGLAFSHLKWCNWMKFHHDGWNEEAEIALTEYGCDEVWTKLDMLFVDGEEYSDLMEGWQAIADLAIKKDILTKQDARPMLKRMVEIVEENQKLKAA